MRASETRYDMRRVADAPSAPRKEQTQRAIREASEDLYDVASVSMPLLMHKRTRLLICGRARSTADPRRASARRRGATMAAVCA